MKRIYIIPLLMVLLLTTCKDRPRTNPVDPDTELDSSEWAPSNLQAEVINDSQIKLSWTQEEERISGFRISRKEGSGSFTQIAELEKDVTEYTDTGLNYGIDYSYRVQAFADVYESGYATSETVNMRIPSPSNVTAEPLNNSEIKLIWNDNCSFESGYKLERSSGGSYTQIAEVDVDVTGYLDTVLTYGLDYTYRVKAFTEANESDYAETTVNFWRDCNEEWGGTAVENECGCVGGNTGVEEDFCFGCTDPDAFNFDTDATVDDGSCNALSDIDGNVYKGIKIGDQFWMAENLRVTHYRNGVEISNVTSYDSWKAQGTAENPGAYCNYDNDASNAVTYGHLYNWYAVDNSSLLCPEDWHVPSVDEMLILRNYIISNYAQADEHGFIDESAADAMKTVTGWGEQDGHTLNGNNASGFSALPAGSRRGNLPVGPDLTQYQDLSYVSSFWTSTRNDYMILFYYLYIGDFLGSLDNAKVASTGLSVRCVKN